MESRRAFPVASVVAVSNWNKKSRNLGTQHEHVLVQVLRQSKDEHVLVDKVSLPTQTQPVGREKGAGLLATGADLEVSPMALLLLRCHATARAG